MNWDQLATEYLQRQNICRVRENKAYYYHQPTNLPRLPTNLTLRQYQQQAIVSWLQNKGRGTLKMATGSGKTIIALAIATELYEKIGLQVLLVVCPYLHLVSQWAKECEKFNLQPILAFGKVQQWQSELSRQLYLNQTQSQAFVTIITTYSSFSNPGLQSQLKFFPAKTLIVGDEAHNLGSTQLAASLPRSIGLRLALSATPERYYDQVGTAAIFDYFGKILQPEFTLADAIKQGALVPYFYYPILVELTETEAYTYAKLTRRIGWALNRSSQNCTPDVTSLLIQRSRLVGAAANKLTALKELISQRLDLTHTLFYCGDGYVSNYASAYSRQVSAVTRLLGKELGFRVHPYTSDIDLNRREKLLQQLERGELQGLVAIRCLDEGVDIPAIRHGVILASTGNPRQFIQRRGRLLRPYPGKKQATVFDMLVIPPELDRETWEVEKKLLRRELKRYLE
ncbi:MAG: DEAD/DEAH box helicase, partial [Cyanobacteria bacterium J083]